jgi:outer membrane protein assembly factor BamE (lipoprotein component of BamABCDE complex)
MLRIRAGTKWAVGIIVACSLAACAPAYRNHGYVPSEDDLSEIVVGVDTKASVEETIGTPSSTGLANDEGFFYVRSRVKSLGLRAPEVVDRQLVAVSFNTSGVVTNIERYGLQDGRPIVLSRRVTSSPTEGKTFVRQLLGNIGQFGGAGLGG